jgi:hypothetical protein
VPETPAAAASQRDDELRLGDLVVIMSEPGPFLIVEIDPPWVTIQSQQGARRKVSETAVRKVSDEPPVAR